jgi:GTP-binding protein
MFVDYATVLIKAGNGGRGCVSFLRERFKPRGGPNGGDGGDGGDVVLMGDTSVDSLTRFRYTPRLAAENGHPGAGNNCSGKRGKDLLVRVPCGTIVRHAETGDVICEITEPENPVTVAQGGKGGRGNQHFATAVRQAPRYAQKGLPGIEFKAELELKIMADVGLVGLPNAGKSSLISIVSHATPKIADYPFTTLSPVVGVVELDEFRTLVMADIPGIIEGASRGRGLGVQFLKHIERTRVLLLVVDISSFADSAPDAAVAILQHEIQSFGHGLSEKPFLIAANKIDIDPSRAGLQTFLQRLPEGLRSKVYPVSTATREGLRTLLTALDKALLLDLPSQ